MAEDELFIRVRLDDKPEIAKEIGNLCAAWAAVEFRIFTIFSAMADVPVPIARAIFFSHHNSSARMDLLKGVAAMILREGGKPMPQYDELDRLLGKIEKSAKKRNKYIHDPYASRSEFSDDVHQLRLGGTAIHGEAKEIEKKDIEQLADQMNRWTTKLHAYRKHILPLLPALHEKLDKSHHVTLVSAKKFGPRKKSPKGH